MENALHPVYLTPAQVSEIYGMSRQWLANMRFEKVGPPCKKLGGKKVLYRADDLEQWIHENSTDIVK